MAYSEVLADRVRDYFTGKDVPTREIKMMGGLCFMVDEKMCVGVHEGRLMARVGQENYENAIKKPGAMPMEFTGRSLKGFIFVSEEVLDEDATFESWLELCLAYNPMAPKSKKRKKKT